MKIPIKKFRIVRQHNDYYIKTWFIFWPFWQFIWQHGEGSSMLRFDSLDSARRYILALKDIKEAEKSPYLVVDELDG